MGGGMTDKKSGTFFRKNSCSTEKCKYFVKLQHSLGQHWESRGAKTHSALLTKLSKTVS